MNEYAREVRRDARRMWLTGRFTDEEVAAKLGIPRADTIRDWRHQEGWIALAKDIERVIDDEVTAKIKTQRGAIRSKYESFAQVLEAKAVRALSDPALDPRDLKAIAGTLATVQKMRQHALGGEAQRDLVEFDASIAGLVVRAHRRRAELQRGQVLGRCRDTAGMAALEESDAAPPPVSGEQTG